MRVKIRNVSVVLLWFLLLLPGANSVLAAPANERPRQLSQRGLENLTAFARLLAYVRFFHPSDQAAAADWDQVAIAGVQEAEKAVNADDLARTLEDFFAPLAPTLRVYPDGGRPGVPGELSPPSGNPQVVYWVHNGVGLPATPPLTSYTSVREASPNAPPAETGLPRPEQPLEVSLGGGVSALLPLALYRDSQGATLPAVTLPMPRPDKPAGFRPSGKDRATRLAGVALAWGVLQHFYPYFDVISVDWPAELRRTLTAAAKDRDDKAFVDTLRRMMVPLRDGHAFIDHPTVVRTHQLPLAWDVVEGKWVITWTDPRLAPGLARGDVILSFNGKPAGQVLANAMSLNPGATPQFIRVRALTMLTAGAKNEAVRLRVQRARGGTANVTVRRSVPFGSSLNLLREPRPDKIAEVEPGIFYLDLNRLNDGDLIAALPALTAARGYVFDLRGYPYDFGTTLLSHLATEPIRTTPVDIPIVTLPDRPWFRAERKQFTQPALTPRLTAPAAWITYGEAVSYAETYLGIVEGHGLGEIVGEATAGTNGTVNYIALPGGYSVRFTGMRAIRHDGSQHFGVGIPPTIPVTRTLEGVRQGKDEYLERAIEAVR
ncbi:MAG TPA: S41 family peptidase [Thermoanaerobaculia bacterium]|nr:S41 family peptidase [Thermoanaerobaculia bacterium]